MRDGQLYEVKGASKVFSKGGTEVRAVDNVSLSIAAGEFVALEGPSGSGKTTLLQLLGALDRPSNGSVFFEGRDLATLRDNDLAELRLRAFGFVFQHFNLIPTLTAVQNVEVALAPLGVPRSELRERSHGLLSEVGLDERASHLPSQLSGGEQQRVAIARALVNAPKLILADEPTGNLDPKASEVIYDLFARLQAERGIAFLVATHNPDLARRAERGYRLIEGRAREID